jgi:hypothetical protein
MWQSMGGGGPASPMLAIIGTVRRMEAGNPPDSRALRGLIRATLDRLKERSTSIDWHVHESAQQLLRLACVRQLAPSDAARDDGHLPTALRRVLREEIDGIDDPPSMHRLLVILLDINGQHAHETLEARRRTIGKTFRPGARSITWGTVRKHHEPRALDELTDRLVARELHARSQ